MPDFSTRSTLREWMDEPDADPAHTRRTLGEIAQVNRWLGGYAVVLNAVDTVLRQHPGRRLRLVDLGCGGGDTLRVIADWAAKNGYALELIGVDINPVIVDYARAHSTGHPQIQYVQADIWEDAWLKLQPDIVLCSLFTHHFDDVVLPQLLTRMYQAAQVAVVVNDLHRHWFAYYSYLFITWVLRAGPMVRYDGSLSVLRSLTRAEWVCTLAQAGITRYALRWRWAFRWQLVLPK